MTIALVSLALAYLVLAATAPFPCWRSYFLLWGAALGGGETRLPWPTRWRQIRLLLGYALAAPFISILWHLDELIYRGYRNVEVRPVFILGQPRSGTTFLHRTLASDETKFVAARHIEWRFPYICVQKLLRRSSVARSLLQRSYWSATPAGEVAARMHPNKLGDWEEDGIFFEECFLHHFFIFLRFPSPELLERLDDFRLLPEKVRRRILETHRRVIQKVLYLNGADGRRYLSKEVTSHSKFPEILALYPDADFIFSLRESAGFMNSLLALIRYSTMSKTDLDPETVPGWREAVIRRMQGDSRQLLDIIATHVPPERRVLLTYGMVTGDIMSAVEKIYRHLGFPWSEADRARLEKVRAAQPDRQRGYDYDKQAFEGLGDFDALVGRVGRGEEP
jgi:hypothetical protein